MPSLLKQSFSPGLFNGLAGLGNTLIDAYQFLGDESYLHKAHQIKQLLGGEVANQYTPGFFDIESIKEKGLTFEHALDNIFIVFFKFIFGWLYFINWYNEYREI